MINHITLTSLRVRWRLKSPVWRLYTQLFFSGAHQRKHHSSASLVPCGEFTGDRWIPAQKASNAENVSIWWRHHEPLFYTLVWCRMGYKPLSKKRLVFNTQAGYQMIWSRSNDKTATKHGFGHAYKVSARNSHTKYDFSNIQISREHFGKLAKR